MPNVSQLVDRGTSELRKGRFSGINQIYHIVSCTDGYARYLETFWAARIVIRAMRREDDAGHTDTLAFVVMPDHMHWLFQLRGTRTLAVCVNTMKSFATRRINRLMGRSGRLWQKGFYDRAIRREEDLLDVARYIVANPLRAGLVKSLRDFPHWDAKWV